MNLVKNIKRLEYANHLIKNRATGDLSSFARKMNLSKRSMADFLSQMKELGAHIKYNRNNKCYYYEESGEMSITKFLKYGDRVGRLEAAKIGMANELCFSESATFVLCKDV